MEARLDFGSFGFSSNLVMTLFSSAVMMPKRDASSQGTSSTAMVQSALLSLWNSSILP